MFYNRKVKFIKSNLGMCIYLDDCLFNNNKEEKLIEVFNLFSVEALTFKCICYIENNNFFLDLLEKMLEQPYEIISQKKKDIKIKFNMEGSKINELITLSVNYQILVEASCCANNETVMQLVINDNDGSCIIFSTKKYNPDIIKKSTLSIITS